MASTHLFLSNEAYNLKSPPIGHYTVHMGVQIFVLVLLDKQGDLSDKSQELDHARAWDDAKLQPKTPNLG